MSVRADCRHYAERTTSGGEKIQRCRLDVNDNDPFACPEGCLFFEERKIADAGWTVERRPRPDGT
ncbi:MAG TPA: hypothetical protein VFA94_03245 [Acidimicrobiales bacterium]|nr:hypothetical protein [Acidimicrobiales bacterium]